MFVCSDSYGQLPATRARPQLSTAPIGRVRANRQTVPTAPPPSDSVSAWSKDEIDTARARCNVLLSGLKAVTRPVEAMRDGECGTPAPVEVISIGSHPQVTFSTPVVMTCDLVAGLHN